MKRPAETSVGGLYKKFARQEYKERTWNNLNEKISVDYTEKNDQEYNPDDCYHKAMKRICSRNFRT